MSKHLSKTVLSFLILSKTVLSQNQSPVCSIISPNNPPGLSGCVNGTTEFFLTEFPEENFNFPCLCCQPGTDDNPPDNCGFNSTLEEFEGIVTCSENFDCCLCGRIDCNPCKAISCNGDESCLGVDPINIVGDTAAGGANLVCDGDISCFSTVVKAEFLAGLLCGGDISCGNSTLEINLNEDASSLTGVGLVFNGDKSGINTVITGRNIGRVSAGGDESAENSVFDLECQVSANGIEGCPLNIGGDEAALNAVWTVTGSSGLDINGDNAAASTQFNIDFVPGGGRVRVTGDNAAENSNWTMTNAAGFGCVGDDACSNSRFNITFILNKDSSASFTSPNSAINTIMNLKNPTSMTCLGISACQSTKVNLQCADPTLITGYDGCSVTCQDVNACMGSKWSITSASDITCVGSGACKQVDWEGVCSTAGSLAGCGVTCEAGCSKSNIDLTNTRGLVCRGGIFGTGTLASTVVEGACELLDIQLANNLGGNIACGANRACLSANITDGNNGPVTNLDSTGISCTGIDSCKDALIIGTCADQTLGCPISCEGQASCEPSTTFPNKPLVLNFANSIKCSTGCKSRLFQLTPPSIDSFEVNCGECDSATMEISGENAPDGLNVKSITCGSTQSCQNTKVTLTQTSVDQEITIGEITCGAVEACKGLEIEVNLLANPATNAFTIQNYVCGGTDSCVNAEINVKVAGVLIAARPALEDAVDITFTCSSASVCSGASINGLIDFTEGQAFNNDNALDESNKNELSTLEIIFIVIIVILVIAVVILTTKTISFKRAQENIADAVNNGGKGTKVDTTIKKGPQVNEEEVEIRYDDNTQDKL